MIALHWSAIAQADLAGIDERLAAEDPEFADRVGGAAIASARFLGEWPSAGYTVARQTRKWRVKGTPYLLLY